MKTVFGIAVLVLCAATVHSAQYVVTKNYVEKSKGVSCKGAMSLSVGLPLDTCVKTESFFTKSKKATLDGNTIVTTSYNSEDCTGDGNTGSDLKLETGKCVANFGIMGQEYAVYTEEELTAAKSGSLVKTEYEGSNECTKVTNYHQKLTIHDSSWNEECVAGAIGSSELSWDGTEMTVKQYGTSSCSGEPTRTTTATIGECTNTSATESEMYTSDLASLGSVPPLAFNALLFALIAGVTLLQ